MLNHDKYLERYFVEIGQISLLLPEEEIKLAKKIKCGDAAALKKLVSANLRFVVNIAKKYTNNGVELVDLISEGNCGLIQAAHRFDETKGFKFITYAVWWIRQAILEYLSEHSRMVRLPSNRIKDISKFSKALNRLEQELEREPFLKEIADYLGIDVNDAKEMVANFLNYGYTSLDASLRSDKDLSLIDILRDGDNDKTAEMDITFKFFNKQVKKILNRLSQRKAIIVKLYYGIDQKRRYTQKEISEKLGLTEAGVSQIRLKAEKELRKYQEVKELLMEIN